MGPYDFSCYLRLSDLQEFQGCFSWNPRTLEDRIRLSHPRYCVNDPSTWPRITAKKLDESQAGGYNGSRQLPSGIAAYDDDIMKQLFSITGIPDDYTDVEYRGSRQQVHRFFYRYPFHCNEAGYVRKVSEIPANEIEKYKATRESVPSASDSMPTLVSPHIIPPPTTGPATPRRSHPSTEHEVAIRVIVEKMNRIRENMEKAQKLREAE